ncbi:DUF2637 domain-containing protein [Rhodococcus sp. D2-41]|uniref:DUF2637 domain-containing protein n=1 Tax=Speluncibacter jeojiensis TaxID=2710754 RepID=UPI00240F963E|nr:DUF2637 domain-containing protein [Rhodococcus sp. D2-41]MDG3011803.1 DUF2637 domain-containing protein [Rhodococcus sp. D2-41]
MTRHLHAAATAAIAVLAFALSYSNLAALAGRAGYGFVMAHTWPFVVDGLAVVATAAVMRLRARRTYAWSLLAASTTVSVVAGAAAHLLPAGPLPGWAGALVAVVPPLCLLVAPHLAVQLRRDAVGESAAPIEQPAGRDEQHAAPVERLEAPECDTCDDQQERTPAHEDAVLFQLEATQPRQDSDAMRDEALRLLATTDMSQRAVARAVGTSETSVRRWRKTADAVPALVAVSG